jgi:signal transduction histidine kinase
MDEAQEGSLLIATTMIVLVAFVLTVLAVMLIYRKRRVEHEHQIALMNEKFTKEVLQIQLEVQQNTMQYIGREIHDNVGQKLTLAFLYTQQLQIDNKELETKVQTIGSVVNDSLADLRNLSRGLIDVTAMEQLDLSEIIKRECDKVQSTGLCGVNFTSVINGVRISPTIKNFVLRIFQEFIQNSIKHSECSSLQVELSMKSEGLELTSRDNGKGFLINDGMYNGGIGLMNMKKRAEIIGASILIQSHPGEGTKMSLLIPKDKLI